MAKIYKVKDFLKVKRQEIKMEKKSTRQKQRNTYRDMRVSGASLSISGREDSVDKDKGADNLSAKAITLGVAMGYIISSTMQGVI